MAEVKLNDIPSNAERSKALAEPDKTKAEPKEHLKPVVQKDSIVATKKPFGTKIREMFLGDNIAELKSYIVREIVIPGVKTLFLDTMESFLLGKDERRSSGYSRRNDDEKYPYHAEYERSSSRRSRRDDRDDSRRYENRRVDYQNIVVKYRKDAEEIVESLRKTIDRYDQATIADLYDLLDLESNYVDKNWGWTDVRDIGIRRVQSGYLIDVEEAKYLD